MKTLTTWEWLGLPPSYKDTSEEALASLSYLWEEDCLWGDQVDQLWMDFKACIEDASNDEIKKLEAYFKRGEKSDYISNSYLFFLTPIKTPLDAKKLFGSRLYVATERNLLLTTHIYKMVEFRHLSWYECHMKNFVQAFYSSGYVYLEEKPAKKIKKVSPNPSYWCFCYVLQAINALNNNESYAPCYDCISYFISILPYSSDKKDREDTKIDELFEWINSGSMNDGKPLSGNAAAFLENLKAVKHEIMKAWQQGE